MTWPPIIRVFFAIEFDPITQAALQQMLVAMKRSTKSGHIRWTRPENFHVTLKFIPTINTQALPLLETHAQAVAKKYSPPLCLRIGSCIAFPHFYRPRVIASEVLPASILEPIAEDLTAVCDTLQLTRRDNTPFRPHVTMGRVKHPKDVSFSDLLACELPQIPPFSVNHIALFRSEPQSDGSCYTVIKRFPLG